MLNRIILIGRLTADPEAKYTPSGIAVTTFRIAVDRPISAEARAQGQEKQADFIDIVAWRQNAEFAANYLQKGRLVAVEGKLQIREYVTQDGQRRKAAEVVADNLKGLDRAREGGEGQEGGDQTGGGGGFERSSGGNSGGGGGYDRAPAAAPSGGGRQGGSNYSSGGNAGGNRGGGGKPAAPAKNDPFGDDYDNDNLTDPFAE
ncbi:MAG: single-stranded DNA-binding protein [Armatimonadota bacterium]